MTEVQRLEMDLKQAQARRMQQSGSLFAPVRSQANCPVNNIAPVAGGTPQYNSSGCLVGYSVSRQESKRANPQAESENPSAQFNSASDVFILLI